MTRTTIPALLVCLLLSGAHAEDPAEPEPQDLHFRLEIGVEEILEVLVGLEGPSFEVASIDLGADGEIDETREIERATNPTTGKPLPSTKLQFEHEGAVWEIDYSALGADRPTTYVRWSVKRGEELYAWFINARVPVHSTADAAKRGDPIRLGPPFAFELSAAQRGRDALVNVGLKDAQGGTLRLARASGVVRKPHLTIVRDGKGVHETDAEYG